MGGVLPEAIEEHPDDPAAQTNNVTDGVRAVSDQVGRASDGGTAVTVTPVLPEAVTGSAYTIEIVYTGSALEVRHA